MCDADALSHDVSHNSVLYSIGTIYICIAYSGVIPEPLLTHVPSRSPFRVYFKPYIYTYARPLTICWNQLHVLKTSAMYINQCLARSSSPSLCNIVPSFSATSSSHHFFYGCRQQLYERLLYRRLSQRPTSFILLLTQEWQSPQEPLINLHQDQMHASTYALTPANQPSWQTDLSKCVHFAFGQRTTGSSRALVTAMFCQRLSGLPQLNKKQCF